MTAKTSWKYTLDHDDRFLPDLSAMCRRLDCLDIHMLGAMNAESGVSAKAANPTSSASGLIQFMGPILENLGWTRGTTAFRALSSTAQLPYVERYFQRFRGKLTSSAVLYVAIFLPAFTLQAADDYDYLLCAKKGTPAEKLGWAYAANMSFDANRDGRILVSELDLAIQRNWRGPRCTEFVRRAGLQLVPEWAYPSDDASDLRTTIGIQTALASLGYNLGPAGADGVPGAATRGAVMKFQEEHGLARDGAPGPATRDALERALAA